jgi:hypothetical protein
MSPAAEGMGEDIQPLVMVYDVVCRPVNGCLVASYMFKRIAKVICWHLTAC